MTDKLLQCPFCGGEASIYHGDDTGENIKGTRYVMAFCGWCGASIRRKNEDEVIKKWNNRHSPWHTGTPTEDGWYLVAYRKRDCDGSFYWDYGTRVWEVYGEYGHWNITSMKYPVIKWQKINELVEEN